jgi:hypothetical protein
VFDKKEFDIELVRNEMNMSDLAIAIDIHPSTMYRKVADNGDFTREEIEKITERLHLDSPMKIFFAKKLT